jgi:hypothetical protein
LQSNLTHEQILAALRMCFLWHKYVVISNLAKPTYSFIVSVQTSGFVSRTAIHRSGIRVHGIEGTITARTQLGAIVVEGVHDSMHDIVIWIR